MKKLLAAVAIAAAFFVLPAAVAQTVTDPGTGVVIQAPMPAPGAEFSTPTQYSNTEADGGVSVPYGDIISELLTYLLGIAGIAAAWLLRRLPKVAVDALNMIGGITLQKRADELLELAIRYGVNTTQGAVRGKSLSLKVGNEVLERAFEYALRHAPSLVGKIGGLVQLREKIIARLDIEAADAFTPARNAIVEPIVVPPSPPDRGSAASPPAPVPAS